MFDYLMDGVLGRTISTNFRAHILGSVKKMASPTPTPKNDERTQQTQSVSAQQMEANRLLVWNTLGLFLLFAFPIMVQRKQIEISAVVVKQ